MKIYSPIIFLILFNLTTLFVFAYTGCTVVDDERIKISDHPFSLADIVESKLDGRRGMIVAYYYYEYKYTVRFSADKEGNSPYPTADMYKYEIKKVDIAKEKAAQVQIATAIATKDSIIMELNVKLADAAKYKAQITSLITEVEKE